MKSTPIKWHGGKAYLAKRILALFPPRCRNPDHPKPDDRGWLHYVEPYFGGGSVLLAQEPDGVSEVVNDLNGELTNFWAVLQHEGAFAGFCRRLEATPFSLPEFDDAGTVRYLPGIDPTDAAWSFFVRCRQSLAGRMKDFAPLSRNRTRSRRNEQVSAWLSAVQGLPEVHARLRRVVILNRDAHDVIRQQDGPRTLFYLDPPYLHETRATTADYAHEMTAEAHRLLLCELQHVEGRFLLSGYRSDLYDRMAAASGWRRVDFDLPNNAAGGAEKRRMTECVWMNFPPEPSGA